MRKGVLVSFVVAASILSLSLSANLTAQNPGALAEQSQADNDGGKVRVLSAPLAGGGVNSSSCCRRFVGLNITSTQLAPTSATPETIPCTNCLPNAAPTPLCCPHSSRDRSCRF